jgi:ankyrin repeat protein
MKHLLLTTIAVVFLVGCGKPPIIIQSVVKGQIEEVKQHLAAGADVNSKDMYTEPLADIDDHYDVFGKPILHIAAELGHEEIVEMLIAKGADINAKAIVGGTALDFALMRKQKEIADLLRKHGGKTSAELKAEGE